MCDGGSVTHAGLAVLLHFASLDGLVTNLMLRWNFPSVAVSARRLSYSPDYYRSEMESRPFMMVV